MEDPARVARAFKAFQDAARNRDSDPETFEAARTRYYFLTKGKEWLEQEKTRIAAEKLDPVLDEYRDMFTSLESEATVQKAYTDSIAAVRDRHEQVKDEATRQVSYFEKLQQEEERKKSAFDRAIELTSPTEAARETPSLPFLVRYFSGYPSSFTILLDILLSILILAIVAIAYRKTRVQLSSMVGGMNLTRTV